MQRYEEVRKNPKDLTAFFHQHIIKTGTGCLDGNRFPDK
jgi:hypothetical protein